MNRLPTMHWAVIVCRLTWRSAAWQLSDLLKSGLASAASRSLEGRQATDREAVGCDGPHSTGIQPDQVRQVSEILTATQTHGTHVIDSKWKPL